MSPVNFRWVISVLLALAVIASAQRITTRASLFQAQVGGSVELPCNIEGLDLNSYVQVVTWTDVDDRLLTLGEKVYTEDPRMGLNISGNNYTLTISSVNVSDSAGYECNVLSEPDGSVSVMHRLFVHVNPPAKIQNATGALVAYDRREIQVGETVRIRCQGYGSPPPGIWWLRIVAGRPPAFHSSSETLQLRNATLDDSGIYECQATTINATSESARVEIVVKDDAAASNRTSANIEGNKKLAEHADQLEAPNAEIRPEGGCECANADESLDTKLRMMKITVHLTRNQKLEFISDAEYQAFKMRNPEYFD